ncbi:hypothetical protein [Rummeliibacillus suwonensis]|nr:hypothetical protein [Rummeliibacillus suwonensis]
MAIRRAYHEGALIFYISGLQYIQYRQELGREQNITINNHLATLKVFLTI